jgi:hypothetical protein
MIAATDRKELVLQSGWVINYIAQQEALAAFQQDTGSTKEKEPR